MRITDINTIFGSVINENLTDEVIVTVIATGFEKNKDRKEVAEKFITVPENRPEQPAITRRSREELPPLPNLGNLNEEDDSKYELPPFLRDRNY